MIDIIISDQHSTLAPRIALQKKLPHFVISSDYHECCKETKIKALDIPAQGKHVLYVQQFFSNNDTSINDQLCTMLLVIEKIKKQGAKTIELFLPYLPYSRQDKFFASTQSTLFLFLSLLQTMSIIKIYTYDLHNPEIIQASPIPIINISATHSWIKMINEHFTSKNNLCSASPDTGGLIRHAKPIASYFNMPLITFTKKRLSENKLIISHTGGTIANNIVLLIDDILDSGKTAIQACTILLEQGAQSVVGLFSHAVCSHKTLLALEQSGFKKIFFMDTVLFNRTHKYKKISTKNILL